MEKIHLVTDKNIVKAGLADHVQSKLSAGGIQVKAFDGGEPEPSIQALLNCYHDIFGYAFLIW